MYFSNVIFKNFLVTNDLSFKKKFCFQKAIGINQIIKWKPRIVEVLNIKNN